MKINKSIIITIILALSFLGIAAGYSTANYKEQGGARWVIGGSLDVASGGEFDVESGGTLKIAGTAVTASAADLNANTNTFGGATFTIGAEVGTDIPVTIQLNDASGTAMSALTNINAYLSDSATGIDVCATAPTEDVATDTDGSIIGEITADKVFVLQSEADGDIDLVIGDSGDKTFYLVIQKPGGGLVVSGAIDFD